MKINSRILVVISIVVVIIAVSSILFQRFGVRPSIDPGSMDDIQLHPGFTIDVYAQDLGEVHYLSLNPILLRGCCCSKMASSMFH
ncbi:MAG: hypothetical protein P1P72_09150 [ANME-2 cluster archaeon]|nr:hypothetical protein [ANME-2 cluster archaeon]